MTEFKGPPNPGDRKDNDQVDEMLALQKELEFLLQNVPSHEVYDLRVPVDIATVKMLSSHDPKTFDELVALTKETIQKIKGKRL